MEIGQIRKYSIVLREIINNRYNPITPKKMKEIYGIDKSSQTLTEYNREKTNLQRVLDFYTQTKIITIVTDTIQNEIKKLKNRKDMENLKPYIELLKRKGSESIQRIDNIIQSTENKDEMLNLELQKICDLYSKVEKVKTSNLKYVNSKNKKVDESLLPSNYDDLKVDEKGYRLVSINGKDIKVKSKKEDSTSYQLVGQKFNFIDVNFFKEIVKYENYRFTNDDKEFITKTICLEDEIDLDNKEVSSYDILYRLFLECDFKNEYGKIESPIEFKIPQKDTETFIEFFVPMIDTYKYDIQSESIVKLSKSDMFQNKSDEIKQFITNTFTKVMIKLTEHYKGNNPYPIQFLIDLVESKSKLNLKFTIDNEEIEFSKTTIKKIIVKENELEIKLSHSTINLSNINQIISIQTYDVPLTQTKEVELQINKQFWKDVNQLKQILTDMDCDNSRDMIDTIDKLEIITDIFIF